MTYQRKTRDEWEVQGNYGYGHGYECVASELTLDLARQRLKEYKDNQPEAQFRVKLVRVKIEQEKQ